MSEFRLFRFRGKRADPPAQPPARPAAGISDEQALRELIDILKQPYKCNCDKCWGVGELKGGGICSQCQGTGRILMDLLS